MKKIIIKDWFKNNIESFKFKGGRQAFLSQNSYFCEILKETEKAINVQFYVMMDSILDGMILWLPKSVVEIKELNDNDQLYFDLEIKNRKFKN